MTGISRGLLIAAALPGLLWLAPLADADPGSASSAAATVLTVYPTANTHTASPRTSISLRGLPAGKIGTVTVHGSRSGSHPGHVRADSDGAGESFFPDKPFVPGEQVTITTAEPLLGSTTSGGRTVSFTVSRPVDDPVSSSTENDDPTVVTHYRSAPDIDAPIVHVVHGALNPDAGDLFLAPFHGPGGDSPMIVRPDGLLVWFHPLPAQDKTHDFRVQTYHGRPVLTWFQGLPAGGHSRGMDEIWSTHYTRVAEVRAGNGYAADHHEFQLTRWGTALVTIYQPVHWNLSSIGGPADGIVDDGIFQEIDIPTGNVLAEWHALDHVALPDTYATYSGSGFDYFHINSLDSRSRGYVLVSGRSTHTIYQVEEATGRVVWHLGGKRSSFSGSGAGVNSQHDVRYLDATDLSVFDNGGGIGTAARPHSRAVVIHLDFSTATATVTTDDEGVWFPVVGAMGSTQVLPSGYVFVGWAGQHVASEFDLSGREIYRSTLPGTDVTYREFRFPWTGTPKTRPAVAASVSGSTTSVWTSWNGATSVASWRVLTGATKSTVTTPAGVYPKQWFEARMSVPGTPAYVRVQALAGNGSVLAASPITAVKSG